MSRLRDIFWYPSKEEWDQQEDILRNGSEVERYVLKEKRKQNNTIWGLAIGVNTAMLTLAGFSLYNCHESGIFEQGDKYLDNIFYATLTSYSLPLEALGVFACMFGTVYGATKLGSYINNNVKSLDNKVEEQNE